MLSTRIPLANFQSFSILNIRRNSCVNEFGLFFLDSPAERQNQRAQTPQVSLFLLPHCHFILCPSSAVPLPGMILRMALALVICSTACTAVPAQQSRGNSARADHRSVRCACDRRAGCPACERTDPSDDALESTGELPFLLCARRQIFSYGAGERLPRRAAPGRPETRSRTNHLLQTENQCPAGANFRLRR